MKITKEVLEKLWYGEWDKELVKQILSDHNKVRTYEEIAKIVPEMYKDWKSILPQIKQNQKLLGLIEKREEECRTNSNKINFAKQFKEYSYQERVGIEFEKLLTESKK